MAKWLLFLLMVGCGSDQFDPEGLAPDTDLPSKTSPFSTLLEEKDFVEKSLGTEMARLIYCAELSASLYHSSLALLTHTDGTFMSKDLDLGSKTYEIKQLAVNEALYLEQASDCEAALISILSQAQVSMSMVEDSRLKFLKSFFAASKIGEEKLTKYYGNLSEAEKKVFFEQVVKANLSYEDKKDLFGETPEDFEYNLNIGKLRNEALPLIKIANTGELDGSNTYSKQFWDQAQEDKNLTADLVVKHGIQLVQTGGDLIVDVGTGSALGKFGGGAKKAKDAMEKINKAEGYLEKAYQSLNDFYQTKVKGFFDGGAKRSKEKSFEATDFVDFEGNIALSDQGAIRIKNLVGISPSTLRATLEIKNPNDVDAFIIVQDYPDGTRSAQVFTATGGGSLPSSVAIPASTAADSSLTSIITVKKDPSSKSVKFDYTFLKADPGETFPITLPVPEVSTDTESTGGSELVACQVDNVVISGGSICHDFSEGSTGSEASQSAASAKSYCDNAVAGGGYNNAKLLNSCPGAPIKVCSTLLFRAYFYHDDASEVNNITCSSQGYGWAGD